MTRVSENSSTAALNYAIGRAKSKLEDIQIKGSTLRSITKPSDNPVAIVEALQLSTMKEDNNQFIRNSNAALLQLNVTEKSLAQLTDILVKAKDIAIAHSSDFYNADVRKNIANEVIQLRNQALSIANKRIGPRYIFGGTKTLTTPFSVDGEYSGNSKHISLEISKDFFIPTNLHGEEIFYAAKDSSFRIDHPLKDIPEVAPKESQETPTLENQAKRDLASVENKDLDGFEKRQSFFSQLSTLTAALENNDPEMIQNLLESFDTSISRLITLRTRIGSLVNSVETSKVTIESENVDNAERKSHLIDADIAELFSDLTKQQQVLKTTYKSGKTTMNQTLLDFIR